AAGGGLRQQGRVAGGAEKDVRQQADPFGGGGRGGQRDEGLIARVGDAVDGGQPGEPSLLGSSRPIDERAAGGSGNGIGQSDADVHVINLLRRVGGARPHPRAEGGVPFPRSHHSRRPFRSA